MDSRRREECRRSFFLNRRQFTSLLFFESTLARINFCHTEMMMGETKRKINALLEFNNKQHFAMYYCPKAPFKLVKQFMANRQDLFSLSLASRTESELHSTNVQGENGHKNIL